MLDCHRSCIIEITNEALCETVMHETHYIPREFSNFGRRVGVFCTVILISYSNTVISSVPVCLQMHDSSLVAPVGHQAALAAATGTLSRKDESRRKELQEKLALAQAMENQLRDANEGLKTRLKESEARTGRIFPYL